MPGVTSVIKAASQMAIADCFSDTYRDKLSVLRERFEEPKGLAGQLQNATNQRCGVGCGGNSHDVFRNSIQIPAQAICPATARGWSRSVEHHQQQKSW
jgi:hypothetical protein